MRNVTVDAHVTLLKGLKKSESNEVVKIYLNDYSDGELESLGFQRIQTASKAIATVVTPTHEKKEFNSELMVTNLMHSFGIPASIKGYNYVRSAIIMCINDKNMINAVTKELYPAVAKMYSTTTCRVERAIRHAIEVAWERGNIEALNNYFGYTVQAARGKPTNSEFIAMIADTMRLKFIAH